MLEAPTDNVEIIDQKFVWGNEKTRYNVKNYLVKTEGAVLERDCFNRGNSVAALVYDTKKNVLLFTEQFRIGAMRKLLELVAGSLDIPGEIPEDAIKREIVEEIGYTFNPDKDRIQHLTTGFTSPGGCSEKISIYYIEVSEKKGEGGGVGDERIKTIEVSPIHAYDIETEDLKTSYALLWFFGVIPLKNKVN